MLQRYRAAETRIGANLHELDNHSTYQVLRTDTLRGTTASRIGSAMSRAELLWTYFGHLQTALVQATSLRGTGSKMRNEDRQKLAQLLTEKSVMLSTIDVPLHERDLLESAQSEERITIEALLTRMRGTYEPIRDAVAKVEKVHRDVMPRLNAAETTLRAAEKEAQLLGVTEPELSAAVRELERVRKLALDDPLALAANAGDELDRHVRLAAGRVASLKKGRDELHGDMGDMAGLVAEIRTLLARAAASRTEAVEKIVQPMGLVRVPTAAAVDGPKGLLEAADAVLSDNAGSWQRQRQLLDDWLARARKLRDQLRRAEASNRVGLNKRDELRGLLDAYRAKMAGVGRAEEMVVREIADEAHNELYTAPTDLARAERLVRELGKALTVEGRNR